ncbi:MAG: hypothetical protein Q9160_003879 [Pyrenula sp. 1 TL-2023]
MSATSESRPLGPSEQIPSRVLDEDALKCSYSGRIDGRRGTRRSLIDHSRDSHRLHQLLDTIRTGDQEVHSRLLQIIQSGGSPNHVKDEVAKLCRSEGEASQQDNGIETASPASPKHVQDPQQSISPGSDDMQPSTDPRSPDQSAQTHTSSNAVQEYCGRKPGQDADTEKDFPREGSREILPREVLPWHPVLQTKTPANPRDNFYESDRVPTCEPSRASLDNSFGNLPGSSAIKAAGFPQSIQDHQLKVFAQPKWSMLPLAYDDGSLLCRSVSSFLAAAQAMIDDEISVDHILGGDRLVVDLFFQRRRPTDDHNRDIVSPVRGNSVNWIGELDAAVEIDPTTGSLYLTPAFEEHVMNDKNWTYSKAYVEMFPELKGILQFKES